MNVAAFAPSWTVWIIIALLAAAALEDMWRLRISNFTCGAVLAASVVAIALSGPTYDLWQNAVVFIAALVFGTLLFSAGWMGGGDVKLFAAVSLWFKFDGALRLVAFVLIAGGLVAVIFILARLLRGRKSRAQPIGRGQIPYGVAIALGAVFALYMSTLRSTAYNPEIPRFSMTSADPALRTMTSRTNEVAAVDVS